MNRLFTKLMWTVAAIMICVVLAVLVSAGRAPHAAATAHPAPPSGAPGVAAGAAAVARGGNLSQR